MNVIRKLIGATLLCVAMQACAGEQSGDEPFLLQFTHGASAAAGIGELKEISLPDKEREIRIWVGFGVLRTDHLLRLRTTQDGNVLGEVLVHYKNDLSDMGPEDAAEFRRSVLEGCINPREGSESNVCTASYRRQPNWKTIYKKLVKLGILTLPDESVLPPPEIDITDGVAMVVEVREGAQYRAYEYSNSWARREPEAVAATDILQIVGKAIGAADGT
ncbi:hypothetical protein J2X04_001634 [Lysobacter niabensis]|uniref:Lipoprotein n=1 Tax=Agrilutibacter niabensis TaxID=380628 RepID=A0ABU1VPA4_9GAMM|nr:hypothetical protein [Lysobacter niabensis]MDR7099287.1 hypothetical protein [Lysobacter niabensis]